MIVICKQTYTMHFVCYQSYGDVIMHFLWCYAQEDIMMRLWLCFALVMLILIPHVGCVFSWINNSCKLLEVSSNAMIVQKVHWMWANSLIIHEIVCIQWISLILTFLTIVYLSCAKVRSIVNHLMLRVYYLPSEELTFTTKFRESPLNKTCEYWA